MNKEAELLAAKKSYTVDDLRAVMKLLRSENGCPWDREQTHESIRNDFLEEAYEAIEAIDTKDSELLREELGDVLLQVVFHTQISSEDGDFTFDDVTSDLCRKLIVRHPHIFSDVRVDGVDDVLTNWDKIKQETKGRKKESQAFEGICKALPSLTRASKLAKRAEKAEMTLDQADMIADLDSKLAEMSEDQRSKYVGDLLFSIAAASRHYKIEAEQALYDSCERIIEKKTREDE